jgi:glycosyltransferase involved in cell wall biosynthesis
VLLTIPCFNEERRLDADQVARLLSDPRIDVLFVDDGSEDGTRARLVQLADAHPGRISVHALDRNSGKAEAVRTGMNLALARGASVVGYLDADFATPPEELSHLLDALEDGEAKAVLGSRVVRLGAELERNLGRRFLGRAFATTASSILGLPIYDSQCGAKLFRDTKALRVALAYPFSSRWAFDVELLGRLTTGTAQAPPLAASDLLEVPLRRWHEVPGSKLGAKGMARAGMDLLALGRRVERLGRRGFFPDP